MEDEPACAASNNDGGNKKTSYKKNFLKEDSEQAESPVSGRMTQSSHTSRRIKLQNSSFFIEPGRLGDVRIFLITRVLYASWFEAAMGLVIVTNSVTIGIELSARLEKREMPALNVLEHLFLLTYIFELSLRLFALHKKAWRDNWVKFDFLIVIVGIFSQWISDPLDSGPDIGFLIVLRVCRLARLARPLRLLVKFRDLWILVRGLLDSASTIFYTFIMLSIILYIFACVGIEIISTHSLAIGPNANQEFKDIVDENFNSVASTVFTLIQFACLDGIIDICKPLIMHDYTLAPYFIGCFLVIGMVQMNLITAVIVNGAFERVDEDKEVMKAAENDKKMKLIRDLRKMFLRLDEDESGTITLDEIQALNEDDRALLYNCLTTSDPADIFSALDIDESGALDVDELCDGIWQISISKTPMEIKRIERQVDAMRKHLTALKNMMSETGDMNKVLLETLSVMTSHKAPEPKMKHGVLPIDDRAGRLGSEAAPPDSGDCGPLVAAQLVEAKLRLQDSLPRALLEEEEELESALRKASTTLATEALGQLQSVNEALQRLRPAVPRGHDGPEPSRRIHSPQRPTSFLKSDGSPAPPKVLGSPNDDVNVGRQDLSGQLRF